MPLRATATAAEPDLLFLPWDIALEQWPAEDTVAMPRGISRHTVRFVRINGAVFAIKEIELGMVADVGTLQRLPRLIVLICPAGLADRAHIDEADLQRFCSGGG